VKVPDTFFWAKLPHAPSDCPKRGQDSSNRLESTVRGASKSPVPFSDSLLFIFVCGHLRTRFQLPDDQLIDLRPRVLSRHAEGILDGAVSRAAVANNADAVDAKQRGSPLRTLVVVFT